MMWNDTMDPESPDFKYTDPVDIAGSDGFEDCDGIDPGLFMGPDGRLWLCYGTYFGYIRILELDPETGLAKEGSEPVDVALSCEAPEMTYHDGWYYLLATHGTCCDGANSTYNIIVGRSKNPTGPFYDNVGRDMIHGGGKLVLASEPRRCPSTSRPTSTSAAGAPSASGRSSGSTAGPWPDRYSRTATTA